MADENRSPGDARTVAATATSFRIIEGLKQKNEAGVSELARYLDLPKSTTHKHLNTLHSLGYVVKDVDVYRLSLRFLGLGITARSHFELVDLAREPLEKLGESTERVASLMLFEHGYGFHALRITPPQAESLPFNEGERLPLHATAGGKAILAYLPEPKRTQILEESELREFTENTTTDRDKLERELQNVHDNRRAYDNEEYRTGMKCVASPVLSENERVVGSVTVTAQSGDMPTEHLRSDIATFLGSTTFSIQAKLSSP